MNEASFLIGVQRPPYAWLCRIELSPFLQKILVFDTYPIRLRQDGGGDIMAFIPYVMLHGIWKKSTWMTTKQEKKREREREMKKSCSLPRIVILKWSLTQ